MRLGLIGRSSILLAAGHAAADAGHRVAFAITRDQASHDRIGPGEFEEFAGKVGAEFYHLDGLNRPETVAIMREHRCDIALSVNWPVMIGAEACACFPLGILNLHAGDLPRYRGNATPNWAILNGEAEMGICVHRIDPDGLDSGPVVSRGSVAIDDDTYVGDLYRALENRGPELFIKAIAKLAANPDAAVPQNDDPRATLRCFPRRPEDSRIDWKQSATAIHRLVRASSHPFGGAFCFLEGGDRITVWHADLYRDIGPSSAIPGQVMLRDDRMPVIACGEGALKLVDVEIGMADGEASRALICRSLRTRLT